jgi:acyl-CoA synthetase (AMP-forming)/AMP-acid ligase II
MTAEPGPDGLTYEFVHGIETLRQLPNLKHSGDAVAVKIPNDDTASPSVAHSITYRQLHDLIDQTGTALVRTAKIERGDIVAIAMPNNVEFILAFLAVPWARAVSAPLNPQYTESEFAYYMEDNQSKCLLVPAGDGSIPEAEAAAASLGLPVYAVEWDAVAMTATLTRKGAVSSDDDAGDTLELAKPTFDPQPEDVALFLHTSGTTARPKVGRKPWTDG